MLLRISVAILMVAILVSAQSAQDRSDPTEANASGTNSSALKFVLQTKAAQEQFHLGEMIQIEEDYSASVSDRYVLLTRPGSLPGGYSSMLSIVPGETVVDRAKETGRVSAQGILQANCAGFGEGGSVGGSGPSQYKLGPEPIRFPDTLNNHFQITAPGRYTITARAANIVQASDTRRVIPVISNALGIDVVRDDSWSHSELLQATDRFEWALGAYRVDQGRTVAIPDSQGAAQRMKTEQELENAAETIRFLDTEESLWQAVRLYDGSPTLARYEYPFFRAILESSHRDLAVRLLPARMLGEDFWVSVEFLDILTAMTIQQEQPISFQQGDEASRRMLNPRTREILKGYALALGESLPSKREEAREAGTKTFEHYASQQYCADEPLVPEELALKILQQARANQKAN